MKKIVISGINFYEGGPLSVYRDCLSSLSKEYTQEYKIIALVHKKELFKDIKNIEFLEFPDSRKSWLKRLYYEYYYFRKISKEIKPELWLSMHDVTPNVLAKRRAVYCHNPMPFYKMSYREMNLDYKLALFNMFYKYAYAINIKKNNFVIVQQNWLREEFYKQFKIQKNKIIVAIPEIKENPKLEIYEEKDKGDNKLFFYPTFPRVFKNIEVICEACKILETKKIKKFVVYITISGSENKYAKWLIEKYGRLENIKFLGSISRKEVFKYYEKVDCLIFPSKIETWGLPITEFKKFEKPIIMADTEYSRETIEYYEKTLIIEENSKENLAKHMETIIKNKKIDFLKMEKLLIDEPKSNGWIQLFKILLN